jgi:hypothetical protein
MWTSGRLKEHECIMCDNTEETMRIEYCIIINMHANYKDVWACVTRTNNRCSIWLKVNVCEV